MRRLIEVDAIRRAFPHYTPEYLNGARKISDQLLELPPNQAKSRWWGVHRQYHRSFLEPGMTVWSTKLLQLVWQTAERRWWVPGDDDTSTGADFTVIRK